MNSSKPITYSDKDQPPASPGVYSLLVQVLTPHLLKVRSGQAYQLHPGSYVYTGSAQGKG